MAEPARPGDAENYAQGGAVAADAPCGVMAVASPLAMKDSPLSERRGGRP
jgi:hypothetical protein